MWSMWSMLKEYILIYKFWDILILSGCWSWSWSRIDNLLKTGVEVEVGVQDVGHNGSNKIRKKCIWLAYMQ